MMSGVLSDSPELRFRLLDRVLPLLDRLHDVGTTRDTAGNRRLHFDQYVKLVLVALFNPMIDSVATLRRAAEVPRVAGRLKLEAFSAPSFSEAPAVFKPEMLRAVIDELAPDLRPLAGDPRLKDVQHLLTIVDGSLLAALPILAQTYYRQARTGRASREPQAPRDLHAWKVHLQFDFSTGVPSKASVTPGAGKGADGERRVLEAALEAGRTYVLDRGFFEKKLLRRIVEAKAHYVVRVQDATRYEVLEERPLTPKQIDEGVAQGKPSAVLHDRLVRVEGIDHPVRLVIVEADVHLKRVKRKPGVLVPSSGQVLILTSDLATPAELVGLIYRYRWTIEVFFKFFKGLLGCRHLLSQRRAGVEIQVYCAVIVCMLLNLTTGLKPAKAVMEVLVWHALGLADDADVLRRIELTRIEQAKREAKRLKNRA